MNLRNLPDDQLLASADQAAKREWEAITVVLHHLREIEARRLFAKLKYTSLFDYAVKRLKYSHDQAARRISAMRLLRELPELEEKIESGRLSLTNISLAQTFFRKEEYSRSEKVRVLAQLENRPSRDAEKILFSQSTAPLEMKPDHVRVVSPTLQEYKFLANEELAEKLNRLRGLLAHKLPQPTLNQLLNKVCDLAIEKLTPKKSVISRSLGAPKVKPSQTITTTARRRVWQRAENKCQNCGSTHALEIDHIQPRALGGTHEESNLRLLCRSCNLRAAVEKLGRARMDRFLR